MSSYSKPDATTPKPESTVTHLSAVLAAGQAMGGLPSTDIPLGIHLLPNGGTELVDLERYLVSPKVMRANVHCDTAEGFIAYLNRFYIDDVTVIFYEVTEDKADFEAVVDYHPADSTETASRGDHRATFTPKFTPEWKRWTLFNGKTLTQEQFAKFLLDNAPDVRDPSAMEMQEIALTLEATTSGDFLSATRLENGSVRFKYAEEITAKAGANRDKEVPTVFKIGIAPFVGIKPFAVTVRLFYRLNAGKLSFCYEIERPHKIIEESAKDLVEKIAAETKLPMFQGCLRSMGIE